MGVIFINARFAPFDPLTLSPVLWLDASDTSTITSSGSPAKVSQWNDKSGGNRHCSQSTAAYQPTTGANTINGRNVLTFDGADYVESSATDLLKNVSGATVYVVRRVTSLNTGETNTFVLLFSTTGGAAALIGGNFGGNNSDQIGGRTVTTDSFQRIFGTGAMSTTANVIHTGWWDYANTDATQYVNETANGVTTSWQSATSTSNVNTITRVGDNFGGANRGIIGYIAEVLVFHSAHNAATRALVWSYLNTKWALY